MQTNLVDLLCEIITPAVVQDRLQNGNAHDSKSPEARISPHEAVLFVLSRCEPPIDAKSTSVQKIIVSLKHDHGLEDLPVVQALERDWQNYQARMRHIHNKMLENWDKAVSGSVDAYFGALTLPQCFDDPQSLWRSAMLQSLCVANEFPSLGYCIRPVGAPLGQSRDEVWQQMCRAPKFSERSQRLRREISTDTKSRITNFIRQQTLLGERDALADWHAVVLTPVLKDCQLELDKGLVLDDGDKLIGALLANSHQKLQDILGEFLATWNKTLLSGSQVTLGTLRDCIAQCEILHGELKPSYTETLAECGGEQYRRVMRETYCTNIWKTTNVNAIVSLDKVKAKMTDSIDLRWCSNSPVALSGVHDATVSLCEILNDATEHLRTKLSAIESDETKSGLASQVTKQKLPAVYDAAMHLDAIAFEAARLSQLRTLLDTTTAATPAVTILGQDFLQRCLDVLTQADSKQAQTAKLSTLHDEQLKLLRSVCESEDMQYARNDLKTIADACRDALTCCDAESERCHMIRDKALESLGDVSPYSESAKWPSMLASAQDCSKVRQALNHAGVITAPMPQQCTLGQLVSWVGVTAVRGHFAGSFLRAAGPQRSRPASEVR